MYQIHVSKTCTDGPKKEKPALIRTEGIIWYTNRSMHDAENCK